MTQPKLLLTSRSPFARRAWIALLEAGKPFELEYTDPFNPSESFLKANPLGTVPVLILPDGSSLPDSSLIVRWASGDTRPTIQEERLSHLALGAMNAAVLYFLESLRKPPSPDWAQDYLSAMERTFRSLEFEVSALKKSSNGSPLKPAQYAWDIGVALEYADFRIPEHKWREYAPELERLLNELGRSPHFVATRPLVAPA